MGSVFLCCLVRRLSITLLMLAAAFSYSQTLEELPINELWFILLTICIADLLGSLAWILANINSKDEDFITIVIDKDHQQKIYIHTFHTLITLALSMIIGVLAAGIIYILKPDVNLLYVAVGVGVFAASDPVTTMKFLKERFKGFFGEKLQKE